MPWYAGPTLLHHLETVEIAGDRNLDDWRFPVQWVIRPQNDERHHDYRGYAGQVAAGVLTPGEEVVVLPSGRTTRLAGIDTLDGPLEEAFPPQSVTLLLEDDLDVSRGDLIARAGEANPPTVARELEAVVCWMADAPLKPGGRYALKHTTRAVRAVVEAVDWHLDVETLARDDNEHGLALNEIGHVRLRLSAPARVRPLRAQPRDRQLHPDRRGDERHRRRRADRGAGGVGHGRDPGSRHGRARRRRRRRRRGRQCARLPGAGPPAAQMAAARAVGGRRGCVGRRLRAALHARLRSSLWVLLGALARVARRRRRLAEGRASSTGCRSSSC